MWVPPWYRTSGPDLTPLPGDVVEDRLLLARAAFTVQAARPGLNLSNFAMVGDDGTAAGLGIQAPA